ncbi:hypothetical protein ABFX02_09G123700 [Erythranthe guttata]
MEKMKMDAPLDFAVFQLSPKRSRCELFVSRGGSTEKLASGLVKPFIAHLKVAEEQVASDAQSVKLEIGRRRNGEAWFTKGTLERFVRFVSTPEVLELVNTFDAEMSQLEAARRIYSQGAGDQLSGGSGSGAKAADDATKKELLRAIDLRLAAVQQDLSATCARADAAGFNVETVSELQMFADRFGAHRLNEACGKFISLSERRPNLINQWKPGPEDRALRSSCGSDMSIDDDSLPTRHDSATCQPSDPPPATTFPSRRPFSRESSVEEKDDGDNKWNDAFGEKETKDDAPVQASHHARRLSVQDRISLFENKQKENSGGKPVVPPAKPVELRRLSSDVSAMGSAAAAVVLRRWSGASDMSLDLGVEKKDAEIPAVSQENKGLNLNDGIVKNSSVVKTEIKVIPGLIRNNSEHFTKSNSDLVSGGSSGMNDRMFGSKTQSRSSSTISLAENLDNSEERSTVFRGESVSDFLYGHYQGSSVEKSSSVKQRGGREDSESPVDTDEQTNLKLSRSNTGESGSRIRDAFAAHSKETESFEKKQLRSFEKASSGSVSEVEDSRPQRLKFNRKANAQPDEIRLDGKSMASFPGKIRAESEEGLDSFSTPPPEQAQRAKRQSKGNQELNDELKVKANELEKLFAEHKLRAPVEQSNPKPNEPSGGSKNKSKPNAAPSSLVKAIDSKNYGDDALKKSFSELGVSEGSRGKSYDTYIKKRDAKLKEDWSSNRAEKEARLKSMHDSLERNKSEMKAKFSGSAERNASVSSARRRSERLRSYNSRSNMISEQQYLGFGDSDEDDDEGRAFDDSSAQGKKVLPSNRNLSSSNPILPRTSAVSAPRSAVKTSTNNSMKRRAQPENPLAQSVPNFSDLRKENTKPSVVSSKPTRSQVRNYGRSKSTSEEAALAVKEEVVVKNAGTKPFLKKGSRARTSVVRHNKASSLGSEPVRNADENDDVAAEEFESSAAVVVIKDDEEERESEPSNTEDADKILEPEEPSLDKFENSGSEDGDGDDDVSLGFSRVDHVLGRSSQLPNESPISWNSHAQQHQYSYPHEISDIDASVDSPVGSPSWSLHSLKLMEADRMRKKWGAAQKPTLLAAAAHSSNSNNNSSRKDMTRGFKRLLKFGRKNRGSENLVDWISATTSEGDDDTEDGRDIANRSSEDLRKSRMGFSHAQSSDYGFNESEFFNESGVQSSLSSIPAPPPDFELRDDHVSGTSIKAPRSFFSLSTFRSKGSESKLR